MRSHSLLFLPTAWFFVERNVFSVIRDFSSSIYLLRLKFQCQHSSLSCFMSAWHAFGVFKFQMWQEQLYEREGIEWDPLDFPDNQDSADIHSRDRRIFENIHVEPRSSRAKLKFIFWRKMRKYTSITSFASIASSDLTSMKRTTE